MEKAQVRMLYDISDVIYDKQWLSSSNNFPLYYMVRNFSRSDEDLGLMKEQCLRYDITIIPPCMLGCEHVKTAGHYHPLIPGTSRSYPEVYQVLEGKALYLMQKKDGVDISDMVAIHAYKGDIVMIPPNYGHVTINPDKETLVMANWVSTDFVSNYLPFQDKKGACYYLLKDGFIKNPSYSSIPDIRIGESQNIPKHGLRGGKDMYDLIDDIEKLRFLYDPEVRIS